MKSDERPQCEQQNPGWGELLQNIIIGVTVSFVALSLGAALGILSGRGALAGMFSAGIIALITALFGGTRIQCSGPTAPMSAVTAVLVATAFEQAAKGSLNISADHFINLVLIVTGLILILMAVFRLGRFISLVPNVVVSGFMSGIALLIWLDQAKSLFGAGGKVALEGPLLLNVGVAAATLGLVFLLAPLTRRLVGPIARFLPATLLAILIATFLSNFMGLNIERVQLTGEISSWADFGQLVAAQIPNHFSFGILIAALPFAFQLALLCYLDTLLTSLVVDKMSGEQTRQDKELFAQGLANGAVALIGGIPGAQATIRSVLMLKENATLRLAGIMVGICVIVEMVMFQDLLCQIPQAVFAGVLFKVGYDVFDFQPLRLYAKAVRTLRGQLFQNFLSRHDEKPVFVTNREMLMILGTAVTTLFFSLNLAVVLFTLLFFLHNKLLFKHNPMRDLKPSLETDGFEKQN